MGEFATLITGPSGTGKELVARAIAESRYVPFDDRRLAFRGRWRHGLPADQYLGAFADAGGVGTVRASARRVHGRGGGSQGWLETCPELGSVFLDELGDLDPAIQVKLLRVIETRTFHPVGDTAARQFRGKLIAATQSRSGGRTCARGSSAKICTTGCARTRSRRRRWRSNWPIRRGCCASWCSTCRGAWQERKAMSWPAKCCRGSRRIWARTMPGRAIIASWNSA